MLPNPALTAAAASPSRMAAARKRGMAAQACWRARSDVAALAQLLDRLAAEPPASVAVLADSVQRWLDQRDWLDAFFAETAAAMRDDWFAAFPFRPVGGQAVRGLALLHSVAADVSLSWVDAAALPQAQEATVLFSATLSVVHVVRAGGLVVQAHCLEGLDGDAPIMHAEPPRRLTDGETLRIDNRHSNLAMLRADTDAVLLRFSCRIPGAKAQHAYDRGTGTHVASAMGDDHASRMLPLLAVARLAGSAARAAPLLAELAGHTDPALRWAAMREWLVADRPAAATTLRRMAVADPDAQVRRTAAATLALLMPRLEAASCPA